MGIFTRFRDIISSNISAMLDKAEDPEKLIKLMIREMEDTLVEIKTSCAGVMASMKKIQRQLDEVLSRAKHWEERAALAAKKGGDDLAREALLEKRRHMEKAGTLEEELSEHGLLVEQYQEDMGQLEDKLGSAREKQRMLQQRHIHARRKIAPRKTSGAWRPPMPFQVRGIRKSHRKDGGRGGPGQFRKKVEPGGRTGRPSG